MDNIRDAKKILERIDCLEKSIDQQQEEIQELKIFITQSIDESKTQNQVEEEKEIRQLDITVNTREKIRKIEPEENKQVNEDKNNLEFMIGGTWVNRIGIVAILFALAYFLKYAFDNNLIGPMGRITLGILAGLILVFVGEYYHKKYTIFAQGLTGGGVAFLFFSIFAAFQYYHFINYAVAFGLLILITAVAVVLSLRYNALAILVLGVVSGFLTPFLLESNTVNDIGLLAYILVLDLGILSVAFFKKWKFVNFISYFATQVVFLLWLSERFNGGLRFWTAEIFVTIFFIIFFAISMLYNTVKNKTVNNFDYVLIILNAGIYFLTNYYILSEKYSWILGLYAVSMAVIYFVIPYFINKNYQLQKTMLAVFFGTALTFITIAIPIQLDGNWVTLSWAIEGLVLLYISFVVKVPKIRIGAVIILLCTVFRLLMFDLSKISSLGWQAANQHKAFIPLLNIESITFLVCIFALFASVLLYSKNRELLTNEIEKNMVVIIAVVANILFILLLIQNTSTYFEYYIQKYAIEYTDTYDLRNIQNFIYSAILIVYSMVTIIVGLLGKIRYLRLFSFVLFLISIIKVFLFDLSILDKSFRILSFGLLGIILIGVSFMYNKYKHLIIGVDSYEE